MKNIKILMATIILSSGWVFATTNFVFVHHSVGYNWLYDGELSNYLAKAGFNVHDTDYGDNVPGTPDPNHNPIGDFTDVSDWYFWFHNHLEGLLGWECPSGQSNQIVMFKSCYPNSAIYEEGTAPGDPTNENATTWNYNAAYVSLTNIFAKNSNTLFIAVTAPPMKPGDGYNKQDAGRGRYFFKWLRIDYVSNYRNLTGLRNVAVFDLLDILAVQESKPRGANALAPGYRTRDSHPNAKGGKAATGAFLPWLRNALNYWKTGVEETNGFFKGIKSKIKSSGLMKLKANIDTLGGAPGTVQIISGTNVIQEFTGLQLKGKSYISKATTPDGKKIIIKLINKREPKIILKIYVPTPVAAPYPLKIDLGNGTSYSVDLLPNEKGKYP
jgi:hypothetical protein